MINHPHTVWVLASTPHRHRTEYPNIGKMKAAEPDPNQLTHI